MEIKNDYSFYDLRKACWSGASDTLDTIEKKNLYSDTDLEEALMELLEDVFNPDFNGDVPTLVEVNDYLWFESDYIFDYLGINDTDGDDE